MRKGFKTGLIAAATVGAFCASVGTASADTYTNYRSMVKQRTIGNCHAAMDAQWNATKQYWVVRGAVSSSGGACKMHLERNSGSGWATVSNDYSTNADWVRTGWHWNGGTSQSRVCFTLPQVSTAWFCTDPW
ncbi:hypothetical protein [Streptomyces sp. DSM 40750]|uniref:hypothetical protein n=1 Tax=Streptomyces sp. DSM 40750 TaxID=2801030 RepID=UPI00214A99AD|nr:hypothetical protein [Streptomyces sp. DSM 40750]UUU19157.1 hypothetical protein JIX55_01755 [Streptomyces sp. DSM 40750]UUU27499.1 hypothetical protein JIX55_48990 [Streptomyces sp. DSM 40750]